MGVVLLNFSFFIAYCTTAPNTPAPTPATHQLRELARTLLTTVSEQDKVLARRKTRCRRHEPDPVRQTQWTRPLRLSERRSHAPAYEPGQPDTGIAAV